MTVKPITDAERDQLAKELSALYGHLPKVLNSLAITRYEARLQRVEEALRKISGWGDIISAVTDYERVRAMADIADAALSGEPE